ncbi:endonuclease V protein, putative, partial [Acanthamoeba castellanii str. Neff]
MHGHERAALRTEKELRHQAKNEVDYPPEILDAWRGEQQRLKSLLIDHDDADWAYPLLRPAAAPLPPVVTPAPSAPKGQPSRPSWSQVLAPSSASAPTVAAPPRVVEVVKEKQPLTLVGGVDLSFFRDDKRTAIAALVVCSFPQLEVVYEIYKVVELTAPYIPG